MKEKIKCAFSKQEITIKINNNEDFSDIKLILESILKNFFNSYIDKKLILTDNLESDVDKIYSLIYDAYEDILNISSRFNEVNTSFNSIILKSTEIDFRKNYTIYNDICLDNNSGKIIFSSSHTGEETAIIIGALLKYLNIKNINSNNSYFNNFIVKYIIQKVIENKEIKKNNSEILSINLKDIPIPEDINKNYEISCVCGGFISNRKENYLNWTSGSKNTNQAFVYTNKFNEKNCKVSYKEDGDLIIKDFNNVIDAISFLDENNLSEDIESEITNFRKLLYMNLCDRNLSLNYDDVKIHVVLEKDPDIYYSYKIYIAGVLVIENILELKNLDVQEVLKKYLLMIYK